MSTGIMMEPASRGFVKELGCSQEAQEIVQGHLGNTPDHSNKARLRIKQILIFLLVEGLAIDC